MTIGQVTRASGVPASAIRFYEQSGVLPQPRRAGGRRQYDRAVLERLAVVERAKACGFSLAETRQLFFGFATEVSPGERWRVLARRKISELDELARRIASARSMLERSCNCRDLSECGRHLLDREGRR